LGYMTQTDPGVGGIGLLVALIWAGAVIAAVLTLRADPPLNPVRAAFRRRLAVAAAVLGGAGLLHLLLRWIETLVGTAGDDTLPVIDWRLWTYLIFLAGIGYLIYVYVYMRTRYAQEVAANRQMRVVKPAQQRRLQPTTASSERAEPAEPRPVATTTRREARRDRKRRSR
jgi:hypothetical protein